MKFISFLSCLHLHLHHYRRAHWGLVLSGIACFADWLLRWPHNSRHNFFFLCLGSLQICESSSFPSISVVMAPTKSAAAKKNQKFVIDCSGPANDKIFDAAAFEKYLHDRIKVEGRTNNLGEAVKIARGADSKITVTANIPFSKRYLKYLTKRFLKKHQLRDWLRVIATDKQTFELKYFNINQGEEEEEEDDE